MSSAIHPAFHYDVAESEVTKLRRALQIERAQSEALQRVLQSREPKYAPIRTFNGMTEIWLDREKSWVPVMIRDGEVTTKQIHDAIRQWELEGK